MPIKVPDNLPAQAVLEDEGVLLINEGAALRQDVRPLEIALLNLMPDKIKTEMQISRLLGATPLQIELSLVTTSATRRRIPRRSICLRSISRGKRSRAGSSTG